MKPKYFCEGWGNQEIVDGMLWILHLKNVDYNQQFLLTQQFEQVSILLMMFYRYTILSSCLNWKFSRLLVIQILNSIQYLQMDKQVFFFFFHFTKFLSKLIVLSLLANNPTLSIIVYTILRWILAELYCNLLLFLCGGNGTNFNLIFLL